jgi:hypothetical protein
MVIANIPWSLKLIYGLSADNLYIWSSFWGKSRKKSFILIGALAQLISL